MVAGKDGRPTSFPKPIEGHLVKSKQHKHLYSIAGLFLERNASVVFFRTLAVSSLRGPPSVLYSKASMLANERHMFCFRAFLQLFRSAC